MKLIIALFYLFFFSNFLFSQDNIQIKRKRKIELTDTIKNIGNSYFYFGKNRSISDINIFLRSKIHDPENEIVKLSNLSEISLKNEKKGTLGFIALGVGTAILFEMGDIDNHFFIGVPVMAVATGFCINYSIKQHKKRYAFTKQAVQLYNQRF